MEPQRARAVRAARHYSEAAGRRPTDDLCPMPALPRPARCRCRCDAMAWRAAAWIAAVLAALVLAFALAHWGWRLFGPASPALPPPEMPDRWTPSIVAAPLFGRAGAAGGRRSSSAPLQGDTRLLGVFAERNGEGYALFRLADRGPVLVRTGQDVAKDVRLEAVHNDGVRIRDHGETRDIAVAPASPLRPLRRPIAAASVATRTACAPPAGLPGRRLQAQCRAADRHRVANGQLESVAGRGQRRPRRSRRQRLLDDARHAVRAIA